MNKRLVLSLAGLVVLLGGCSIGELAEKQFLGATCAKLNDPDSKLDTMLELDRITALAPLAKECAGRASMEVLTNLSYGLSRAVTDGGFEGNVETKMVQFQHRKTKYYAFGVLAAYIPDEKFNEMVKEQIAKRGVYHKEVGQLAAMRYRFIADFRLKPLLTGKDAGDLNMSQLREAMYFYRQLGSLAQSPQRAEFSIVFPKCEIGEKPDAQIAPSIVSTTLHAAEGEGDPDNTDEDWQGKYITLKDRLRGDLEGAVQKDDLTSPEGQKFLSQLK